MKIYCTISFQAPKDTPSADNGNSPPEDIDKVSLLSPKSSATASYELNSDTSSAISTARQSGLHSTSSTSHSTLMGSTPRKHLRGGAESGTIKTEEREVPVVIEPTPDLDSSDSDITLLGISRTVIPEVQNQMHSEGVQISPSTRIYSREPPERDESQTGMRNISDQALQRFQTNEAHSKSDSSVPPKCQRCNPEDYFNTSLIDGATSCSHRDYESSTSSNLRETTALQKYRPKYSEYAIDDDGTYSESTYDHDRRHCAAPSSHEATHQIKHYRGRCAEKKYDNHCNCRKCKCCHCHECHICPYTDEEQTTSYSNSSLTTDFMDLAYQNNNEYLGLVHELESTLSARNKERVRKTMREFEYLSRHNKSLEKPIFDDDDEEEEAQTFYRSTQKAQATKRRPRSASGGRNGKCYCQKKECICCFSRRAVDDCDRRLSTAPAGAGYKGNVAKNIPTKPAVGDAKPKPVHCGVKWRMDPRTGEWYKVYDDHDERFCKESPRSRHRKPHTPPEYHREPKDYNYRTERCASPRHCCCRHGPKY